MANRQVPHVSITASVPQGSSLGPLLFSVFTDDLGDKCENTLYLYPDNCVMASVNRDLERMSNWADNWKVTFESCKCKALTISGKRNPTSP